MYHISLLKKHSVIQFDQKLWLKPYKTESMVLKKIFFKLMNNSVFRKTMENVKKHRDIELVTTDNRRNQLVPESNHHTTKYFSEKCKKK